MKICLVFVGINGLIAPQTRGIFRGGAITMECPKCGKEMELTVNIEIRLPSRYLHLLSKKVIRKKECTITSADWGRSVIRCHDCGIRICIL